MVNRRWRVPPPPEGGFGAAEGAAVLEENAGGLGVLLWDVARDLVLWATSRPRERAELFAPAAERTRSAWLLSSALDPVLEAPLLGLVRVTGQPSRASRERVAMACREIARWADAQGAVATANAFAHAAAIAVPANANLCYEAGRFARRCADYPRAERWLKRAILLGRQKGEWEAYATSLLGLGNTHIQRGDYPRARRCHLRCLHAVHRHNLKQLQGPVCHDLCVIATETGRVSEINVYARMAYEAYGDGHPRLPMLAHDVAYGWMCDGYFTRALEVFEAVASYYPPAERIQVLADICRAAAGAGNVVRFEQAWQDARAWIERMATQEHVAQSLLEMARGASMMRRWDWAAEAARRSCEIATNRREARVRLTAETVLEAIRREHAAEAYTAPDPLVEQEVDALACDLVESLSGCVVAA